LRTRRADYRHWCSTAKDRSVDHVRSADQHLHHRLATASSCSGGPRSATW
jgi:hypothetical protein